MGDTKIKINLRDGTFEIEGSESFVEKYWDKLESSLEKISVLPIVPVTDNPIGISKPDKETKPKNKKKQPSLELIPLNLEGGNGTPSLKQFFEEKSPKSHQEIITVFCYYLNKHLSIKNMRYGHALFCYNEVKKPKSNNIVQLFTDTIHLKKWVEVGDEPNTIKITIAGENLVEHNLPLKIKQKK
ncbi:MAG TPA: hypothetical protein VEU72_00575 [Nitrosopumilaceae archaeon]|nr:hypothetical protein [Nitrosopumilaceae archaeon]